MTNNMKEAIKVIEEMIGIFEEVSNSENPRDEGYYNALKDVELALRTKYVEIKRMEQ